MIALHETSSKRIISLEDDTVHGIIIRDTWKFGKELAAKSMVWNSAVVWTGWGPCSYGFLRFRQKSLLLELLQKETHCRAKLTSSLLFGPQPAAIFKSLAAPTEKCPMDPDGTTAASTEFINSFGGFLLQSAVKYPIASPDDEAHWRTYFA